MRAPSGHALTAAALLALPEAALAQEVPLWVAAGLFSPLVMLILAAILGWLRHSVLTAVVHGLLIVVWVATFAFAARRATSDLLLWAPAAAYALHGLLLVVLVAISIARRRAAERAGL